MGRTEQPNTHLRWGKLLVMEVSFVARAVLAIVFLVAAFGKLRHPGAFASTIRTLKFASSLALAVA